jgi:hypothetical protein
MTTCSKTLLTNWFASTVVTNYALVKHLMNNVLNVVRNHYSKLFTQNALRWWGLKSLITQELQIKQTQKQL